MGSVPKTVSVITPSFNRADIVGETAASIFNQTYPHWEWVVVDDGSTDNSWEVLQGYAAQDTRVKVFQRDREPKGACTCRNIAVQKCTGDFVMFLDTDDVLASFCLEQRVRAFAENPEADFIIFPMLLFKNHPADMRTLWNVENGRDDLLRILEGDPICQGTGTLWKKAAFQNISMWREDLKLWQDIELHIRSLLGPVQYIKRMDLQPDVFLRVSEVSLSRTAFNSLPKLQSRMTVFVYAFETIKKKNALEKYASGLRHMAGGIILNAVNSSNFSEANQLMDYCRRNGLFTTGELKKLKRYAAVRRYKLYKIESLNQYYYNKANAVLPSTSSSIGTVTWTEPVTI